VAYALAGQSGLQAQRRPATLDLAIGATTAQTSGLYSEKSGVVLIGTFVAAHRGARILAVSAGLGTGGFPDNKCVIQLGGDGTCAPSFPPTAHVAVAEGYEFGSSYLTARGTLGPTFYLATRKGESPGVGGQLAIDFAAGSKSVKLLASGRYTALLRKGETVRLPGLEIGLRL
jgi:hypothetical protein